MTNTIALIAHDDRKDDLVRFASAHAPTLSHYHLIATARTGEQIQAATGLPIQQKLTSCTECLPSHSCRSCSNSVECISKGLMVIVPEKLQQPRS